MSHTAPGCYKASSPGAQPRLPRMAFLWVLTCLALASTVSGTSPEPLLCPPIGCGVPQISPSVKYSERIINGQNAVSGSWPWQVSLQTRSGSHFCGGSLINEYWVVTAAHCEFSPYNHVVVLGEYNLNSATESVQVKTVSKAVTHPSWNAYTLNNDITLLKLSSPAQLNSRVSPVCLASANLVLSGNMQCVTTGWGRTHTTSNALASRLQQVTLPLISQSQCQQYWGSKITSSMLCAGGAGASSCQGDSGGPLVYNNGNSWTLIGIVSWGSSNCNVNTPAVYTRVSHFRNWIDQIVAQG
ncbi:hypothetical protein ASZ78_009051 [Callipepla squamata]|uniref:Peptidase S1 domain-containing protein n=1 Tax=Callipepla squamata TaxID=9009 RepID=A0A226MT55_CALSU|nr:hypothetical protein ASZ78_009051 [Callipepla squamata]